MTALRWGVLSTGAIARLVIDANRNSPDTSFTAVASRDLGRAQSFAAELALPPAFGSYDELLASSEIDAVYVDCRPSATTTSFGRPGCWTPCDCPGPAARR